MKDFHVWNWLLEYESLKILAILVIYLPKKTLTLNSFLKCYWKKLNFFAHTRFAVKAKIILKLFKSTFSNFLLKALCHQNVSRNILQKIKVLRQIMEVSVVTIPCIFLCLRCDCFNWWNSSCYKFLRKIVWSCSLSHLRDCLFWLKIIFQ